MKENNCELFEDTQQTHLQLAQNIQKINQNSYTIISCKNVGQQIDCLIILNGEIDWKRYGKVIQNCSHVLLADGGANKIYKSQFKENEKISMIVGDLDSIEGITLDFYAKKGVKIEKIIDQDYNDFQKSIIKANQQGWHKLGVLGAYGSRVDHFLATFSIVTSQYKQNPHLQIILFNPQSIIYPLKAGITYSITRGEQIEQKGCGLISFGNIENIETEGFKWNLGKKYGINSLQWGQFISSSNEFVGKKVKVCSSQLIFLTCQIKN